MFKISVSAGDFIDRMSILKIKESNGLDVSVELKQYSKNKITESKEFEYFVSILESINRQLWDLEDRKRKHVSRYSKEESDVALLITLLNDMRHEAKKRADSFFESDISEKKSH